MLPFLKVCMYSVKSLVCVVEMYDNCNEYIFWSGANEAASIQALHQFVFHEISKYVDVQQSGVKQHSFTFQRTGNEHCLSITLSIGEGVCQHKTAFNHNFLRDSWHRVQ